MKKNKSKCVSDEKYYELVFQQWIILADELLENMEQENGSL